MMRRASNITAYATIVLVVLGVGGVHTAVAGVAVLLGVLAVAIQTGNLRDHHHASLHISLFGIGLALLALVSLLQLIPLPPSLQELLNPRGWALTQTGLELVAVENAPWRPFSLDPAATADRALRFIALALFAVWGANDRSRRSWRTFGLVLIPLGLLTLGLGYYLHSSGTKSVYGIYESLVGFRGPSTFINLNHGAAFFGFAAIVSIGTALGFRRDNVPLALGLGAVSLFFVAAAAIHQSDGVLLALALSAAIVPVLAWFRAGRPVTLPRDTAIGIALLSVLSIAAAIWLDLHRAAAAFLERVLFSGEHGGRLALVRAGAEAIGDYWIFGAGAGATQTLIPAYVDWAAIVPASIPVLENDTLEILLGFGLLAGGLAIATFAVQLTLALRTALSAQRSIRFPIVVVCAVYFACIAQLHFPLFALGLGIPIVVWLELLWSRRTKSSGDRRVFESGHLAVPRTLAIVALVLTTIAALLAAQAHYRWYRVELTQAPTEQEAARFVSLRPADHRVYARLATIALREGEHEQAVELARYAAERETSVRMRLFLARVVARSDQTTAEELYAELVQDGAIGGRTLTWLIEDLHSTEARVRVLGPHPETWMRAATLILPRNGPRAVSDFVVELAEHHPDQDEVFRLGARMYLQMNQPTLARLWAEVLADRERDKPDEEKTASMFAAQALVKSGEKERALQVLAGTLDADTAPAGADRLALTLRGGPEPEPALVTQIEKHFERHCASPIPARDLLLCWSTDAWLDEARGEYSSARDTLARIHRRFDRPFILANFYVRHRQCARLEELQSDYPPEGAVGKKLERLRRSCQSP